MSRFNLDADGAASLAALYFVSREDLGMSF